MSSDKKIPKYLNFDLPTLWDILTIVIYGVFTFLLFYKREIFGDWKFIAKFYVFLSQMFLIINYVSLRKFLVWVSWLFFALFHIFIYQKFYTNLDIPVSYDLAIEPLRNTWVFLLLFQSFRIYSIASKEIEIAVYMRSLFAYPEDRPINYLDLAYTIIAFWLLIKFQV